MSQSVVTVRLNGTPYQIGCGAGEEDHVAALGAEVEEILQSLITAVGQIGEARLLAMAALILADKAGEAETSAAASAQSADDTTQDAAAQAITAAADRIAALAETLASRRQTP